MISEVGSVTSNGGGKLDRSLITLPALPNADAAEASE